MKEWLSLSLSLPLRWKEKERERESEWFCMNYSVDFTSFHSLDVHVKERRGESRHHLVFIKDQTRDIQTGQLATRIK